MLDKKMPRIETMHWTKRRPRNIAILVILSFGSLLSYLLVMQRSLSAHARGRETLQATKLEEAQERSDIVITGGMGNLGKYVIAELLFLGYSVVCIDIQDLSSELDELLDRRGLQPSGQHANFSFIKGDIRDEEMMLTLMDRTPSRPMGVIHLAAVSRVAYCFDNQIDCLDVNVRGTQVLLDCMEHLLSDHHRPKPWIIFASSAEIYGSDCEDGKACNESSPANPVNLYGKTKWQGEEEIRRRSAHLFSGHILLRLSSIYGGVYDLPERLIPALALNSMRNSVIDIHGGNQLSDFVHINDVVASFLKATNRLNSFKGGTKEDFLICSGESNSALQALQYISDFSGSTSMVRMAPSDERYPSTFVCDNRKMRAKLPHAPTYPFMMAGLADYMSALYHKTAKTLSYKIQKHCTASTHNLDVPALDNCSLYIMSIEEGSTYLSHLSWRKPTRHRQVGNGVVLKPLASHESAYATDFRLRYERGPSEEEVFVSYNGTPVTWKAIFHPRSGGYILEGQVDQKGPTLTLGDKFQISEAGKLEKTMPLSIWPYSCPPDTMTGKARLPTEFYDPSLYLLHEIIPSEDDLRDRSDKPLYCQRILAARDRATHSSHGRSGMGHGNDATIPKSPKPEKAPEDVTDNNYRDVHWPLCDSDCDLPARCVNTGACRCVAPFCGPDLKGKASFPFHNLAFTNNTSFYAPEEHQILSNGESKLPYSALLQAAAIPLHRAWQPPRVHVLDINITELVGECLDKNATEFARSNCFVADHFLRLGFERLETSSEEADFLFVPFYQGWFMHYKHMKAAPLLERVLAQARTFMDKQGKIIPLVLAATHDFGANMGAVWDMRESRGKSLAQHPLLSDVLVLSPYGDFNTLAYMPQKDVVIPPATCNTPLLFQTYPTTESVKESTDRHFLVDFHGSTDRRTGSSVRAAFMSGSLFPNSNFKREKIVDQIDYMQTLNNSIFCAHLFGTAGWSPRLIDSIYAGCIPVLTSDITHPPFHDVLDWSKFSVYVDWRKLQDIEEILLGYSAAELRRKQAYLLTVRDAFVFDPDKLGDEISGRRKGPIYYTLMSLKLKAGLLKRKELLEVVQDMLNPQQKV